VQPTSAEAQVLRHNPWYSQQENTHSQRILKFVFALHA